MNKDIQAASSYFTVFKDNMTQYVIDIFQIYRHIF